LVTLPVEFDAAVGQGTASEFRHSPKKTKCPGVNETLDAAALTYVGGVRSSLGYLLYLLSIFGGEAAGTINFAGETNLSTPGWNALSERVWGAQHRERARYLASPLGERGSTPIC